MFPGSYFPDDARPRVRKSVTTSAASPHSSSPTLRQPHSPGNVSVAALPYSPVVDTNGHACATVDRVDTKFALPPALITCLVRHIDSQHNVLATPAVVERCLRDLQRRLMPWVPVERLFGSTMRATAPAGAPSSYLSLPTAAATGTTAASAKQTVVDGIGSSALVTSPSQASVGAVIPGGSLTTSPPTSTPQAGSYLAGSHVRLQLAKTTDNSVVVAVGASVLHLLFYAVDQPESRPSHLVHIVQEWMAALKTKGEEHDCMVLLVHSDLVAASEAAARMAEEAQQVGGSRSEAAAVTPCTAGASTLLPPPPSPLPTPATAVSSSSSQPAVSQDKVDAAAAVLRKYQKELQDLKFSRQQVSAYMPNDTPMRILERLRPAVIARGGRLRQALQIAVARKRQFPQDPSTKPVPVALPPSAEQLAAAAAAVPTPSLASPPTSYPRPTGGNGNAGGDSPRRTAASSPSTIHRASTTTAAAATVALSDSTTTSVQVAPAAAQYFNIQSLWRTGYDLVVHYLQYGLVFDARETLEHLYLEYYNNSDDYVFLRTPIATLERLGRIPNLFDAHGHGGWDMGQSGYPKALETGSELLEGLLLLAAAEMTCSLLLGQASAALLRYNTFVQVTREKFEEWTAAEAKAKLQATATSPQPPPGQADTVASSVTCGTYQQFFLLQCYLSGLRVWWPTSGLCRPRRVTTPRAPPSVAPAAVSPNNSRQQAQQEQKRQQQQEKETPTSARSPPHVGSVFSPLCLPPLKAVATPSTDPQAVPPAADANSEDDSVAIALRNSPLLLPATGDMTTSFASTPAFSATYVTSSSPCGGDSGAVSAPAAPALGDSQVMSEAVNGGSGVRYSMTNPSFAAAPAGMSISGTSFRGPSSFAARSNFNSAERHGVDGGAAAAAVVAPLLDYANAPRTHVNGTAMTQAAAKDENHIDSSQIGVEGKRNGNDDGDDDEAELVNFELRYLMAGSEDTAQVSAGYLMELAASTGLVPPSMEPEELSATAEAICEAVECGDDALARELLQRQRQLRRSCVELASLLERARDSLSAVAHDLRYSPFCHASSAFIPGGEQLGQRADAAEPAAASTAFSNIDELSSPAQALRLWRILAAMAALALHLGDQRRREFHLYTRLAVTFLPDHPTVTANIVADRLLPYVKTLGWSHVELFVRRLYVEAREQLMRRAGLFRDIIGSPVVAAQRTDSGTAGPSNGMHRQLNPQTWLRVFRTGPAYALYRECILVLLSSRTSGGVDNGEPSGAVGSSSADGAAQTSRQEQEAVAVAPSSYVVASMVGQDDAVGALDTRLFSQRSQEQWWRALLRVDAVVMDTFYFREPPEYPLSGFTSPLMVRSEKQHSSSAVAASLNATPFPHPVAGSPAAEVDEVVRLSFAMACAMNPLIGPDGGLHLRVTSPNTPRVKSALVVRLQLTLESRKDWADEEEVTHVVHIRDCEEAAYDKATRQLRCVFLFPVCHAGVYRVRRIRVCNGKTWLAHYPQHSCNSGGSLGRRGVHRGLLTLLPQGGYGGGGAAFVSHDPASQMCAVLDAAFQPVTCAPVLRVPEPRSSVHLKLTLPDEVHCFADSVDYVTLDVDLEDPLSLTVASGRGGIHSGAAGQQSSFASSNKPNNTSVSEAPGATAAEAGGTVDQMKEDGSDDDAACTCFYEASPGNLLMPLTVATAEDNGRRPHSPAMALGEDAMERSSQQQQQRFPSVSPVHRALLGADGSAGAESANGAGASDCGRARGPPLVAAVVLGTPSIYRQRATSSTTGSAAASSTRANLSASFSHYAAPRSSDTGGATAAAAVGSGGLMGLGSSFSHRGFPSFLHQQQQQKQPHVHRHSSHRTTPAEAHLSSSARSASYPMGSSPPSTAPASATAAVDVPRAANSSDLRYKSIFKSMHIGTTAETAPAAATPTAVHVDTVRSPSSGGGGGSTSNTRTAHRQRSRSAQQHARFHRHTHPRPLHRSWSPVTSEHSAHDGVNGGDDAYGRRAAPSLSGAGLLSGAGASPLHEVDVDTFELVLRHPVKAAEKETNSKAEAAAVFSSSPVAKAASAAASVACTSIPIHLGVFLNSIPTPEAQVAVSNTSSSPGLKQATELASSLGPLLQAVSSRSFSVDHLRENVIHLLPSNTVLQASASGAGGVGNNNSSPATTHGTDAGTLTATSIPITQIRLRLPLLPLLVTPAAAPAQTTPATTTTKEISATADSAASGKVASPAGASTSAVTSPSSAEAAKWARIVFTRMRGREPSTTSLSVNIPFQLAISFDYAFKHFQGRVYCLVRMRNLLKSTSLWMRGAVLRVLDPEPSYEIVRVCDVYNQLLLTEWKPQEELSVLYELDLIASFHPVQPECAHQVQMQVFYSSWEKSFLPTPAEDRLVLRTIQLPSTEATAESVELIHGDGGQLSSPPASAFATEALMLTGKSSGSDSPRRGTSDFLRCTQSATTGGEEDASDPPSKAPFPSGQGGATPTYTQTRTTTAVLSGLSDHSEGSITRSVTQVAHSHSSNNSTSLSKSSEGDDTARRSGSTQSDGGGSSSVANSGAVHFNVVTLRHLEDTCNAVLGPVATFHSKHLCVFNIVMYAESPWTMRFGAATNYVARAPATPLSRTPSTIGARAGDGPLPRSSVQSSRVNAQHLLSSSTISSFNGVGGTGTSNHVDSHNADSFFGNAMVDQPSDFIFVAGEPVRFCVRLQPLAQNWPEDANMEETFFIRLKYNPMEWMVIGKQRDRRTLSLMEEVTVYFNAVPLLPRASAEASGGDDGVASTAPHSPSTGRGLMRSDNAADDDDGEESAENAPATDGKGGSKGSSTSTSSGNSRGGARSSRPLAGHAVRDEGILQTPTVEMFWERKKPSTAAAAAASCGSSRSSVADEAQSAAATAVHGDAVMGESVLIDVVQFRTWVRVRKRGH
jgi:hypothetical protein